MVLLDARDLTKDFGGLVAVKNVSFQIREREIIGLIGPNGAGKTTLFNLVTGMDRPDSGSVTFEGRNITKLRPHKICKLGISRTYQSVRPFLNHSVRENVAVGAIYGRKVPDGRSIDERVDEILSFLDLKSKENYLSRNLPIEERKMVEVGRALAGNPKLLMLDEPMAGLNPSEVGQFVNLVKRLNAEKGLTVLIVEHLMKAISSLCSRVIVMHHGEVLAEGTPSVVLTDSSVIEVYLGESFGKEKIGRRNNNSDAIGAPEEKAAT